MNIYSPVSTEESLGARIRRLRVQRGLSLRALAQAVGVTPPAVVRWERGTAKPRQATFARLSAALGADEGELWIGACGEFGSDARVDLAKDAGAVSRQVSQTTSLRDLVASAKEQIARAAGTTPDPITVTIEV